MDKFNVHVQINAAIYNHYRTYLQEQHGIIVAGQYGNIKGVTAELLETVMDLVGEGQKLDIDTAIEGITATASKEAPDDIINESKRDNGEV